MNTNELVDYYASLLIKQYRSKPKAYATIRALASLIVLPQTTVETITFSGVPASGQFSLTYEDETPVVIAWDDSSGDIQTALRGITGLEDVTVTGAIADGLLTVTFVGVDPPAALLEVSDVTLETSGSDPVSVKITETDVTLPIAVQNAFNVTGDNTAVGKQLDVLGKYVNVYRSGYNLAGEPITLDDADFLQLIRLAIGKSTSGSSLADIQNLLVTYFPDEIIVTDLLSMQITYTISTDVGSQNLIEMMITQNLLPRPMAVGIPYIIFTPDLDAFFGYRTYAEGTDATPFNTYDEYDPATSWLSYHDVITL